MPSFRAQGVLAISCAAALTFPIAFYAIRHRVRKTRETHEGDNFASLSIDRWTTAHVEKWLHTLGVSDEAIAVFVRNEMDGPTLLLCEDSHLQTLSLKLRDFLLVRDALKQLRTEKINPPVEAELPAHVASRAPSQRGAHPAVAMSSARSPHSHEGAAEETCDMETQLSNEEQLVKAFLDETSAIHTMLSAQKFREAPKAVQNEVRAECAERLNGILPLLSGMPPQLRATLLPLANKVNTLINDQPDAPNAIKEQIDSLHKMVDGFLRLLDTAGEGLTTDPQLATLRQRIGSQIREVMAVAASLPPPYGEPLRRKCALVLERVAAPTPAARADGGAIAANRNNAATPTALPTAPTAPAGAHGMDQMAAAVGRLREIFSSLRSSDIVRMKPEARLERVGALLREVRGLEAGVAAWGDRPGAEVIRQVSATVEGVLLQMESITREELAASQHRQAVESKQAAAAAAAAAVQRPAAQVPEPEAPKTGKAALEEIVASLKAATQMVKSEEFAGASTGVQTRVAQHIQRNLRDARSRVARMPLDEATATVAEMINRTLSVINTIAGEGDEENEEEDYEVAADSVPAAAAHRIVSRATDTTEGNPAAVVANPLHSTPIEATVAELEEMFGLLNSDRFAALPQAERAEAAAEMLRGLEGIEQRIERLGGDSAAELRELIKPLADILRLEAGAAPTPLFRGLLAGIKQIEELVTSEGFNTATAERRRAVARTIIPEMMRISDALPRLPPYERAEIQRMMETINKALQDVANGGGSAGPEQATSTETRNDRVEDIASRIEAILSFMQSATFERSPLAVRCALAQELVGRLDAMDAECLELGGEAMSMLPVVRRLRTEFASFARALNTAVEEGTNNNNGTNGLNEEGEEEEEEQEENGEEEEEEEEEDVSDERRAATFEAVARLSRALRGKEHISPSEVDTLRRCIALIDSLGCETPEEQLQRTELASLLEREVTNLQAQGSSRIEAILANAVAEFARNPPRTEAQLRPYVEILTRAQENIEGLSGSALSALSTLRTEVLNKLRAMQNGRVSNNQYNDDSENNANRSDNNNDENPDEDSESVNSHIARMLMDISNRLRDGPLPEVILGQFEDLLDRAEALGGDPARAEAIALIREQINLQRISNGSVETQYSEEQEENEEENENENEVYSEENDVTEEEKNNEENERNEEEEEENNEENEEENNEENNERNEEEEEENNEENEEEENNEESAVAPGPNGPAAESVESLRSLPDEGVPGAELCALLQLPRIERRLASESPPLTPFDVQCMSAVILSLNTAERVRSRPELRQRVNLAKLALARRIEEAADGAFAAAPHAAVECVVVGAGRVALRVAGEPCGGDQCVGLSPESIAAESISRECMASWVGRSTALFVCGDDAPGATSRGELSLLHDLLVSRYAFDVVTVPAARAAETRRLIAAAAADGAARLFVLYRAAAGSGSGNDDGALDACEFADGSRLSHAEVVAAAAAVDRVLVVRVEPFRLSALPARRGVAGPPLTATATAAAQDALRPGRCWLFDGLFAPAIAEVLARADGAPVSPAGVVAGPAAAIAGLREVKGAGGAGLSVAGNEAATMAFFVPFDTEDVEGK